MVSKALILAIAIRSCGLLLPQTYFQPDEFYQAYEPAFFQAFGSGFLTWEWRDLPGREGRGDWWSTAVVGGRLRGWLWPGVFYLVYRGLAAFGLEGTEWVVMAPRVIGVLVAALTDYFTYLLAVKVLGSGSASGAMLLSLTSLFNAHLLPRALSTSPETLLTTMALCFYPLPAPEDGSPRQPDAADAANSPGRPIDCGAADRIEGVQSCQPPKTNLVIAAFVAALSICIRPTMLVFWGYLHLETTIAAWRAGGAKAAATITVKTIVGGLSMLAVSTLVDWLFVHRLVFPVATFFHQNILLNIAASYGATGLAYHVTQSLPILLFPIWYWWGKGFTAALLPRSILPTSLAELDSPRPLATLARSITFALAVLSLSPHSEWRFVHPLLPQLLLFALPALHRTYQPTSMSAGAFTQKLRQYCRIPRKAFYIITLAPIVPYLYLNIFHGAAQVEVINSLRRGDFGQVTSVVALMPCHSTPWASHLGSIPGWFLTCEPPLAGRARETEEAKFYSSPVSYLNLEFPRPPSSHESSSRGFAGAPSHVLLFGDVLGATDSAGTSSRENVAQVLRRLGYNESARLWNGFDIAQDDSHRRGGVRVWTRDQIAKDKAHAHREEL
ncbi:glycosylphosphatidylinositol anchor biosynthesis [Vanrija albida]|uniref:Mannosyltransferase n=1 Tax=Vanrija albida TaxID=181172 RepID=A0ABR3Q4T2_9TREE